MKLHLTIRETEITCRKQQFERQRKRRDYPFHFNLRKRVLYQKKDMKLHLTIRETKRLHVGNNNSRDKEREEITHTISI